MYVCIQACTCVIHGRLLNMRAHNNFEIDSFGESHSRMHTLTPTPTHAPLTPSPPHPLTGSSIRSSPSTRAASLLCPVTRWLCQSPPVASLTAPTRMVSLSVRHLRDTAESRHSNCRESKALKGKPRPFTYRNCALKHLPQSEPHAILGSKYVMATPAQFVKLSERWLVVLKEEILKRNLVFTIVIQRQNDLKYTLP